MRKCPQRRHSNGWKAKETYVMAALERHDENFEQVFDKLDKLMLDTGILKSRGAMYIFLAGAMPALAALATILLGTWLK